MRKIVLMVTVFLLTGIAFFSCKEKKTTADDKLTLVHGVLKTTTYLNDDPTKKSLLSDVSIEFPLSYSDGVVLNKVRKQVLLDYYPEADTIFNTAMDVLKAYLEDYNKFFIESEGGFSDEETSEYENQNEDTPWTNNQSMNVRFNEKGLFSYTVFSERFTGGAHGGKNFINTVIDLKSGEKITEDDLFNETTKPLIVNMIIDKIMKTHKVGKASELQDIGYFDVSEIGLNKNFYLDEKGLTYTFNEYEIAAYAVGATEVRLGYNEIADLLKPGSPVDIMIP